VGVRWHRPWDGRLLHRSGRGQVKGHPATSIQDKNAAGTTIVSDCWRAYDCLDDSGYQHLKVNHSINFVDSVTKANTQKIERLWWDLKENIPHYGRKKVHYHEYLARFAFAFASLSSLQPWRICSGQRASQVKYGIKTSYKYKLKNKCKH